MYFQFPARGGGTTRIQGFFYVLLDTHAEHARTGQEWREWICMVQVELYAGVSQITLVQTVMTGDTVLYQTDTFSSEVDKYIILKLRKH
jgi:hypothetical protein